MATGAGGSKIQERLAALRSRRTKLRQQVPWPVYVAGLLVVAGIRFVLTQPNGAWLSFAVVALSSIGIGLLIVALRIARENTKHLAELQSEISALEDEMAGASRSGKPGY